jgi:uncharacterized protein YukE
MDPSLGDPEAMRGVAARLQMAAERIATESHRLRAQVQSLVFEGPAAERFRDATFDRHRRAIAAAGRLQDLAHHVVRRANEAEDALLFGEQSASGEDTSECGS